MTGRKSGHVCAVRSCRNKRYNSKKRFFCFPKRIERARMWARKASRKDLLDSIDLHKSHRLCEDHFETTMFTNHLCERLSANAFPTLFPPLEEGAKGIPPDHTYSRPGLVLPVKMEGLENNVGVPVKKEESPTFSSDNESDVIDDPSTTPADALTSPTSTETTSTLRFNSRSKRRYNKLPFHGRVETLENKLNDVENNYYYFGQT